MRLSSEYGTALLPIDAISVGIAAEALNVQAGSLKKVTFNGRSSAEIPDGARILADLVDLRVQSLTDLVVSVYAKDGISAVALSETTSSFDPGIAHDGRGSSR